MTFSSALRCGEKQANKAKRDSPLHCAADQLLPCPSFFHLFLLRCERDPVSFQLSLFPKLLQVEFVIYSKVS